LEKARDQPQRRRLAAARGSEERDQLARLDVQREALDGGDVAVALGQRLDHDAGPQVWGRATGREAPTIAGRWVEIGCLARSMRGWLQPALADLVEQRIVADLENERGIVAILPHVIEHFLKGFALGFSGTATCDLPQS